MSSISPRSEPDQLRILMTKVASGDTVALREIYLKTSPKLYGYAFRILHKHEFVEDVIQETFIAIWQSATYYQSNRSAPMTWMTTILRNKAFDLLRTINQPIEIDADNFYESVIDNLVDLHATPLEVLESNRHAHALATCMALLESAHRQVVYMYFFEDMSHSEIAARLDIPAGTIKTWIRRSIGRLETSLNKLESKKMISQEDAEKTFHTHPHF